MIYRKRFQNIKMIFKNEKLINKINLIFSLFFLVSIALHSIIGMLMLIGKSASGSRILGIFAAACFVGHFVCDIILCAFHNNNSNTKYPLYFFADAILGFFLILHIGMFGYKSAGTYYLHDFNILRLVPSVAFAVAGLFEVYIMLRYIITIKPIIKKCIFLSILICLLFAVYGFLLYFKMWSR